MISKQQVELFHEQGFIVIPELVDMNTIGALRNAHQELLDRWSTECEVSRTEYERVVSQWTNVHQHHQAFEAQIHDPNVAEIACLLLNVPQVQLFHDQVISKPAIASATIPWHQDFPFWPVDKPSMVSCWLALDDADAASGSMYFMPGTHREGAESPVDLLASPPKAWGDREQDKVPITVKAGDCVFHDCLSWHTSYANTRDTQRRAFISIIMDADCRWKPEHSDWHPMNQMVSVDPGERFNTDKFPLLSKAQEVAP